MKKLIFALWAFCGVQALSAQTLEKMNWFNEPEQWEIKELMTHLFIMPNTEESSRLR